MKLATIRTMTGTTAVRLADDKGADHAVELAYRDVGELLADPKWRSVAAVESGISRPIADLDFAPVIPLPEKVICVGMNYADHIAELGRTPPEFPTLFPKFARTLIGAHDPIALPAESHKVDWEAELAIVIGSTVRRANERMAIDAIAGFTVLNDISMRDFQRNTSQFMAGKIWENTTPLGPWLWVSDEPATRETVTPHLKISCSVDGEVMQSSNTQHLIFDPVQLVRYISQMVTLVPGDVIATGTPGGVGAGRDPEVYLTPGQTVVTTIDGIGECRNETMRDN